MPALLGLPLTQIAQMDASLLRTNLMKLGLPTSGKLEALRKRLSEVPAKE